jgi:hypothetical protein
MAVKTKWLVEHECGDDETHDLSGKRPSERAGYARWLKSKECSRCWRKSSGEEYGASGERWLAERRSEEAIAIGTWERRSAMPALDGSEKSIPWGSQVRYQLLAAVWRTFVLTGELSLEEFTERFEVPTRCATSASWWIDQRDTDPRDLEELLCDVASSSRLTSAGLGSDESSGQ